MHLNIVLEDYGRMGGPTNDVPEPFYYEMKDGHKFTIHKIGFLARKLIRKQLEMYGEVHLKFCVHDDEEYKPPVDSDLGVYEVIVFPMYGGDPGIKQNEQIHNNVVPDTIINGNVSIDRQGNMESRTNYCDVDYRGMDEPVLDYVSKYIAEHLKRI